MKCYAAYREGGRCVRRLVGCCARWFAKCRAKRFARRFAGREMEHAEHGAERCVERYSRCWVDYSVKRYAEHSVGQCADRRVRCHTNHSVIWYAVR